MKRRKVRTSVSVIAAGRMVFSPVAAIAAGINEAGQMTDCSKFTLRGFVEDTEQVLNRGNHLVIGIAREKYLFNSVHGVAGSSNCHVVFDAAVCNLILEQRNSGNDRYIYDYWKFGIANKHALAANAACRGMVDSGAGPEQ